MYIIAISCAMIDGFSQLLNDLSFDFCVLCSEGWMFSPESGLHCSYWWFWTIELFYMKYRISLFILSSALWDGLFSACVSVDIREVMLEIIVIPIVPCSVWHMS